MRIEITPELQAILARRFIELPLGPCNINPKAALGRVIHLGRGIDTAQFLKVGSFSYSISPISNSVLSIGRYCSFASFIKFGEMEHPTQWLSSSSFTYDANFPIWKNYTAAQESDFQTAHIDMEQRHRGITIGNDVWIGARAYIRGGVTIGHGAIIGSDAVVTKDVEPYGIVVGNPGIMKKKRFDDKTIERLLKLGWWDYDYTDFAGIEFKNIDQAIDQLQDRIASGQIQRYDDAFVTFEEFLTELSGGDAATEAQ